MSYSTVNEFLVVYPKLNGISPDQIGAFLARGAARIDAYIGGVVSVPVSPAPPLLTQIEQDLAYLGIMKRNSQEASKDSVLQEIEDAAVKMLEEIRDGKILLFSAAGAEIGRTGGSQVWSSTEGHHQTFGVGDVEDAVVDPDRMDEEEDARG